MTRTGNHNAISRQLARRLLPLALAVGFLIAVVTPSIFYTLESRRAESEATNLAKKFAEDIANLAAVSPALWKYQATKYSQILHSFVPHKDILNIFVVDETGNPVAQYQHDAEVEGTLRALHIHGSPAPIMFNNRKIGEVEVTVSIYSILVRTLFCFLLCALTGIGLSILIYHFPLRVVAGLEDQILDYQQTLEQKVEERTLALQEATEKANRLSEEAQAANRAKSQFLANMSHEIRTPLNGVLGMAEILLSSDLTDRQQEIARGLYISGETLLRVINDILDFSKIEAGRLELDLVDFDLGELVDEAIKIFSEQAQKQRLDLNLHFQHQKPVPMRGDPGRLKQVLSNLLSNAIKFTADGEITLSAKILQRGEEDSLWLFEVADTGIGIQEKAQECIFESFIQADGSTTRKYGGTGLGLAICKQLCHLMGGEITLESRPGEGSIFRFTALLKKPENARIFPAISTSLQDVRVPVVNDHSTNRAIQHPQISSVTTQVKSAVDPHSSVSNNDDDARRKLPFECNILLAEDNAINQRVAKSMLEMIGCKVDIAGNGREVLEAVSFNSYDAVLMDCQMPELDGYEATRLLRERESAGNQKHVPIIALTGFAMQGDREACLKAGMDDYLSKPFSIANLKTILSKWLV